MPRDKRAYWRRAAALYALALLRFAMLGFSYRPLLDDYIQYYNYANLMGSLPEVVRTLGLFAARPLAGLADIVVWSHFWPCLFVAVALLAALLTAAALLFERLFDRMVGIGPLFACFFLLLPVNFEATYWLSAATRIVPGLVLAACAGLCTIDAQQNPRLLWGAFASCLLAAGFYEQCFVLAAGLSALCGLFWTKRPLTRAVSVLSPCAAYGIYAALCAAAGPSALYGARTSLVLPFRDEAFFTQHLPQVVEQMVAVFKAVPALTLRALLRFPRMLWENLWPALPMLLLLLALLWGMLYAKPLKTLRAGARQKDAAPEESAAKTPLRQPLGEGGALTARREALRGPGLALLLGVLLCLGPFFPFFVVANPWIGLRALGAALPGLALFADAALRLLPLSPPARRAFCGAALSLLLCATLPELADYRLTAAQDAALLEAVAQVLPEEASSVALVGVQPCYLPDQNYEWHEHLHGVTESQWATTGALRQVCGSLDIPTVTPLAPGSVYADYADLTQYDAFLLVEGAGALSKEDVSVTPVFLRGQTFVDTSGRVRAEMSGGLLTLF